MNERGAGAGWNRALLRALLVLAAMECASHGRLGTSPLLAVDMRGAGQSGSSTSRAADEAALQSLVAEGSEAWGRGDAKRLAAIWAEDGELIAGDGSYHVGRSRITEFLTRLLSGAWKESRFVGTITSVRFLGPDLALLHLNAAFIKAGESEAAPENRAAQSILAAREGSAWRVTLYQSTRVRPPSSPAGK